MDSSQKIEKLVAIGTLTYPSSGCVIIEDEGVFTKWGMTPLLKNVSELDALYLANESAINEFGDNKLNELKRTKTRYRNLSAIISGQLQSNDYTETKALDEFVEYGALDGFVSAPSPAVVSSGSGLYNVSGLPIDSPLDAVLNWFASNDDWDCAEQVTAKDWG